MKSILFVCLGNICRSPMAETIFIKIVAEKGDINKFTVDSAGLHGYHKGEMADVRMRSHAKKRGYDIVHISRPIKEQDLEAFDYIVGMDDQNIKALYKMATIDSLKNKIYKMTNFLKYRKADDIPDPYYGGSSGFENVIDLLEDSCNGFWEFINNIKE